MAYDPLIIFSRTSAELAAGPTPDDKSSGVSAAWVDKAAPTVLYRLSPDRQSFVATVGGALTTLSGATDIHTYDLATQNAPIAAALAAIPVDAPPRLISGSSYTLGSTAGVSDDRATLYSASAINIVIPTGLNYKYGTVVLCPISGADTVTPGAGVSINAGTVAVTGLTRALYTNGFAITPNPEANSYGVSVATSGSGTSTLAGATDVTSYNLPANNVPLAAALNASPEQEIIGLPADGSSTDAASTINSFTATGGSIQSANKTTARFDTNHTISVSRLEVDAQVSVSGLGRGGVLLQALPALPALTPQGSPNSIIRSQRRSPVSTLSLSTVTEFRGFTIDGKAGTQTSSIIGIRIPNPNPGNNPNDPDPNYASNKDNKAPRMYCLDVLSCSGDGIVIEGGNGTGYLQDVHSIGNQGRGVLFSGNDNVLGPRNGFGNNGGHAVQFGSGSGGLVVPGNNIWGGGVNKRSGSAAAMFYNGTSGGAFGGSVIQDTVIWKPKDARGVISYGNVRAPLESVFIADGVASNLDETNQFAPTDMTMQSWDKISGGYNSFGMGDLYTRCNAVAFATAADPAGAAQTPPVGQYGTAFKYFKSVTGGAEYGCILPLSSYGPVKAWTSNTQVPVYTQGGWCMGLVLDQHTGLFRNFAQGQSTTASGDAYGNFFMFGAASTRVFDYANYLGEIGETNKRTHMLGVTEFDAAPVATDASWDRRVATTTGTRVIKPGQPMQELSVAGGGIATYGITLPMIADGQTGSYAYKVVLKGGPIATLTFTGTAASNSTAFPTAFAGGYMALEFWYSHDQDTHELTDVYGQSNTLVQNAAGSGAAVSVATSGTIYQVATISLPPGTWDVTGGVIFTAPTAATVTLARASLSTSGTTIPATSSKNYSRRVLGLTGVTGDFDTHRMGPFRVTVPPGAAVPYYLTASSVFTAGTVSVFGDIEANLVTI